MLKVLPLAGALLSINEQAPAVVLRLHQIIPVLTLLSTAGTLYLLLRGQWQASMI